MTGVGVKVIPGGLRRVGEWTTPGTTIDGGSSLPQFETRHSSVSPARPTQGIRPAEGFTGDGPPWSAERPGGEGNDAVVLAATL
jgi:hypothetical protein